MKRKIRLTESDLHRIVKESVKKLLKEENGYIDSSERWFAMVSGDYIYFYNRRLALKYAYNPRANKWYGKIANSDKWVVNVAPDIDFGSPHKVRRICGVEPEQLEYSIKQVRSANREKCLDFEFENQYKEEPRRSGSSREEKLDKWAKMIKGGKEPYDITERDVDLLIRSGRITTRDVQFVFGEQPRFYGGYNNHNY